MRRFISMMSVCCLVGITMSAWAADTRVDLELVLAVDVSQSMDADEQRTQREGYVEAFRHPAVMQAINSGEFGRIAVAYLEWARPGFFAVAVPWTRIGSRLDAEDFAAKLSAAPPSSGTGTSISSGLLVASGMFAGNGFAGSRQTIDVSGDGPNNLGIPIAQTRDLLVNHGFTINGLPIMMKFTNDGYDIPNLDAYYQDCVIGGPGAFMVRVVDVSQFEATIRRKLILEISGLQPRLMPAALTKPAAEVDCLVGEKARHRLFFPDR